MRGEKECGVKMMERNREMALEKNEQMMEWKKNDRIQVRIEDISDEGLGIGQKGIPGSLKIR